MALGSTLGGVAGDLIPIPGGGIIGNVVGGSVGKLLGGVGGLFGKKHHDNPEAYNRAPNDKVTLFNDSRFNGSSRSIAPGMWVWLGKRGRDEISSVKVPKGLKLEVWTGVPPESPHGNPNDNPGRKATWTSSKKYVGDAWNDKIDTVRVSRINSDNSGLFGEIGKKNSKAGKTGGEIGEITSEFSEATQAVSNNKILVIGAIIILFLFFK